MKITYDLGANNGSDIPCYLLKSDRVIAVEANPVLCDEIRRTFQQQINEGCLVVVNCVVNINKGADTTSFFIHKYDHVHSQLPKPKKIEDFDEVILPSRDILSLVHEYGRPYYIKIDIEYCDEHILRDLFSNNIFPPFVSAESHNIEVFSTLISLGKYNSFKLVDGYSVSEKYKDHRVITKDGSNLMYSFPYNSAGPFGNDINGPWMTGKNFFKLLAFAGLGWKDIHATNIVQPDENYAPKPVFDITINF